MHARLSADDPAGCQSPTAIGERPTLGFRYDPVAKIIRVTGVGAWTVDYVDVHFAELAVLIDRVRAQNGEVLALIDLSRAPVQSDEVAERIHSATARLYTARDRIALIVQSFLLKAQMKRATWQANTAIFVSPNAAETWLCAHRPD
ncbi:MAG TPA: hypothetical protein VK980_09595 [Sphingomonas sp.]|nr:hypothetical protein [Sphingomonas sp.]